MIVIAHGCIYGDIVHRMQFKTNQFQHAAQSLAPFCPPQKKVLSHEGGPFSASAFARADVISNGIRASRLLLNTERQLRLMAYSLVENADPRLFENLFRRLTTLLQRLPAWNRRSEMIRSQMYFPH